MDHNIVFRRAFVGRKKAYNCTSFWDGIRNTHECFPREFELHLHMCKIDQLLNLSYEKRKQTNMYLVFEGFCFTPLYHFAGFCKHPHFI